MDFGVVSTTSGMTQMTLSSVTCSWEGRSAEDVNSMCSQVCGLVHSDSVQVHYTLLTQQTNNTNLLLSSTQG